MLLSWLLLFYCCLLLLFSTSFLLPSPRFRMKSSLYAVLFSYRVSCSLTKYLVLLPSILFSYRVSCSLTEYLVLLPSILFSYQVSCSLTKYIVLLPSILFSYRVSCHTFLSMLICLVATLVPLLHRFQRGWTGVGICLLVPTGAIPGCYVSQLFSDVSESWFCFRWVISLELELDFSCDQVVVSSYTSSTLEADVLQGSSKGTEDTYVINLVLCLMVW